MADGERVGRKLAGGVYTTLYLSPRRLPPHPLPARRARAAGWRYVPGKLWPVNPASVKNVPGLFTVNERLVTLLESPLGLWSPSSRWAPRWSERVRATFDPDGPGDQPGRGRAAVAGLRRTPIPVARVGRNSRAFEMGSTVILLFEPGRVDFAPSLVAGARVRVGEPIGGPPV